MSNMLAFLPAAVAAVLSTTTEKAEPPALPTFKPRWWHNRNRLDARPVMWSLRNRPDDWEWRNEPHTLRHKPSKHIFWVANGPGFYHLYETDGCSCLSSSNRGKFQRFQQIKFWHAFRCWRRHQPPPVDQQQFAAHFVR